MPQHQNNAQSLQLWMFEVYHRSHAGTLCSSRILAPDPTSASVALLRAEGLKATEVELVERDDWDHGIMYVMGVSLEDAPMYCSAMYGTLGIDEPELRELLARGPALLVT